MQESYPEIVFTSPGKVELLSNTLPSDSDATWIETECSIVSPGTELACLSGKEWWATLPFRPGYGSVGRVVKPGKDNRHVGERVFTYGVHAKYSWTSTIVVPIPEKLDAAKASFARLGCVAITSLRVADVALGDTVVVFGLGLVGNMAAQLFTLAGCTVIGIDLSERRRELALECGIAHAFSPGPNLVKQVADLTGGRMCRTVVEATGVPAVAEQAIALAGKGGELILLGSPRGAHSTDITPFLNYSHLWDKGCITIKGAHEWRFPVLDNPHARHSIENNARVVLDLIAQDKLKVTPLLTHRISPASCQEVYDGLLKEKDRYLGVVFDWSFIKK